MPITFAIKGVIIKNFEEKSRDEDNKRSLFTGSQVLPLIVKRNPLMSDNLGF